MPRPRRRGAAAPPNPPPPAPGAPAPPPNRPQRRMNWMKLAIVAFIIIVLVGGACAYCSPNETPTPTSPGVSGEKALTLTREWSEWIPIPLDHKIVWDRAENVPYEADIERRGGRSGLPYFFPADPPNTPDTCARFRKIPERFQAIRFKLGGGGVETEMHLNFRVVPYETVGRCEGVELPNATPSLGISIIPLR